MANIVTAALLQTDWTGDQASMIDKHEQAAHEAAAQGAQIICFQELFYGPYFCQVQDPISRDRPVHHSLHDIPTVSREPVQPLPSHARLLDGATRHPPHLWSISPAHVESGSL